MSPCSMFQWMEYLVKSPSRWKRQSANIWVFNAEVTSDNCLYYAMAAVEIVDLEAPFLDRQEFR